MPLALYAYCVLKDTLTLPIMSVVQTLLLVITILIGVTHLGVIGQKVDILLYRMFIRLSLGLAMQAVNNWSKLLH